MTEYPFTKELKKAFEKVKELTTKTNKRSILIILQDILESNDYSTIQSIRESISNVICIISVADETIADIVLKESLGVIDEVIIDSDNKRTNSSVIKKSFVESAIKNSIPYSFYSDIDTWVSSSIYYIKCVEDADLADKRILILGRNILATRMITSLITQDIAVDVLSEDYHSEDFPLTPNSSLCVKSENLKKTDANNIKGLEYDIVIGCSLKENYSNLHLISDCIIKNAYDIGIKNFSKEFIEGHEETHFYRSDDRAGIASAVINIMESEYLVAHNLGRVSFAGINVASGGYVGKEGDVIVDNAFNPSTVLGIANGDGTFKTSLSDEEINTINKINTII